MSTLLYDVCDLCMWLMRLQLTCMWLMWLQLKPVYLRHCKGLWCTIIQAYGVLYRPMAYYTDLWYNGVSCVSRTWGLYRPICQVQLDRYQMVWYSCQQDTVSDDWYCWSCWHIGIRLCPSWLNAMICKCSLCIKKIILYPTVQQNHMRILEH